MTTPDAEPDQDAEPTMTAPPGERPDGASVDPDGRAESADVPDTDGAL